MTGLGLESLEAIYFKKRLIIIFAGVKTKEKRSSNKKFRKEKNLIEKEVIKQSIGSCGALFRMKKGVFTDESDKFPHWILQTTLVF